MSTATPIKFGMWVLPVKSFLQLDLKDYGGKLPPHQLLRERGLLVEKDPSQGDEGAVGFVSHQWLGWYDADPDFEQLFVLRRFFERILTSDITNIKHDPTSTTLGFSVKDDCDHDALLQWARCGYIWFDYFSVPQTVGYDVDAGEELMNAVESIPAYVELSKHFVVLCPPCDHKDIKDTVNDFASWNRRGWCRAEAMARLLARSSGPMIKLQSAEGNPEFVALFFVWQMQPGMGQFTCCERSHSFERTDKVTGDKVSVKVDCDKVKVGNLVHLLVDAYEASVQPIAQDTETSGDLASKVLSLRWIMAMRQHMSKGLETEQELQAAKEDINGDPARLLVDFLASFRFPPLLGDEMVNGTADDHLSGFTPLFFAVIAGKLAVAKELVRRGADVHSPLLKDHWALALHKSCTLLHIAASHSSSEMVGLLLDNHADAMAKETTESGRSAIHLASAAGNVSALCVLLDREPRLLEETMVTGHRPLHIAARMDPTAGSKCVIELLRRGANGQVLTRSGNNALMCAAMSDRGDCGLIDALLKTGKIDVNTQSSVSGQTALMVAARNGVVPAVRSSLAWGADTSIQDLQGNTALDMAMSSTSGGPFPTVMKLLTDAKDP